MFHAELYVELNDNTYVCTIFYMLLCKVHVFMIFMPIEVLLLTFM